MRIRNNKENEMTEYNLAMPGRRTEEGKRIEGGSTVASVIDVWRGRRDGARGRGDAPLTCQSRSSR